MHAEAELPAVVAGVAPAALPVERLAAAFMAGPVAVAVTSFPGGGFLEVNAAFLNLTGRERGELLGANGDDVGLWVDPRAIARLFRALQRGFANPNLEVGYRTPDGGMRMALVALSRFSVPEGERVLMVLVDVTARTRAEARQREADRELRRTNDLLMAMHRAQSAFIARSDPRTLLDGLLADLLLLTGSAFGFIGEAYAGPDGASVVRTIAMSDTCRDDRDRALYDKHLRSGLEFRGLAVCSWPTWSAEPPTDLPPGRPEVHTFLAIPLLGAGEAVVGMIGLANRPGGYAQDIVDYLRPLSTACANLIEAQRAASQRLAAEEALRESEERFRLLVDGVRDYAVIMLDVYGRVASWNAGAERITGFDPSEALGLHVSRFHPGDAPPAEAELDAAERDGRFESEGWRVRKGGARFWASIVVTPLRDAHGQLRGFAKVMRDITERRELDRMKCEFVSVVSHELRTPLTAIRGGLGMLEAGVMGALPPGAAELARIARSNAERLTRLINDILDLEKIEAGKVDLRLARVEAGALVRATLAALEPMATQAGVTLRAAPGASCAVHGDEDRLTQVLTNLVSNAIKFSPAGQVVEVTVAAHEGHVRFGVVDHGAGIPSEQQSKLFGKFQQLDSSNTRKQGGTGLGLAISKALVEQHGGRIGVDSAPGTGSEFWFELPATKETT